MILKSNILLILLAIGWGLYSYDPNPIFSQTATTTVANTNVETTLTNTGQGSLTLPADYLKQGTTLNLFMTGTHSATGNPSITIKVKLGGTTICTTGVVTSGNSTNTYFEIRVTITCYTTGATGTVWAQGYYLEAGGGSNNFPMSTTTTSTINTTIANAVDETVTWGTASASNTQTATNFVIAKRQ